ncbi:MAG: hypothetical protein K6U74_11745 [Firmicutes bacterium]|nr:hypothetical protein [Bacillota bacterium]
MTALNQVDSLNKQPINQLAKMYLKKAGMKPDPDMLHLYQLVEWGLSRGKVEVRDLSNPNAGPDLLEAARRLMYLDDSEKALNLLVKEGPDKGNPKSAWVDPVLLMKQKSPEEAARYLAECLKDALESLEERDPALED